MKTPFDDPEFRAQMAKLGVVHSPGMAERMLGEIAPLLADEGIDLDDFDGDDLDGVNAALARATERHNLTLFTPIGAHRAGAFATLRRFTDAIAAGDDARARGVLAEIAPEPDGDRPAISHVIGVSLGVLDARHTDPALHTTLSATRVPKWGAKPTRAAAGDILALATKGRAFDSLGSLHRRHGGLAIFEGAALVIAASVIRQADAEGVDAGELAGRVLADGPAGAPMPAPRERPPSGPVPPSGVLPPSSAFSRGGNASPRANQMPAGNRAQRRARPSSDRRTLREFGAWLGRQPSIAAPNVADETRMLEALLELGRTEGLDAHDPDDIDDLIDVIFDVHDPDGDNPEASDAIENALEILHDYVHFRLETSDEPDAWEDAHEAIEGAIAEFLPGANAIADAIDAAEGIDPAERRAAFAGTRVIAAVHDLLAWIGASRPVTQSGGLRRADIQPVAAMIGISAVGVAKYPAGDGATASLIDIDMDMDMDAPLPEPATIPALSMYDVPVLSAWWEALTIAGVIERTATRVRPGPAATDWLADALPPLELAEMVTGMFVADVLGERREGALGVFEAAITVEAVRRLALALAPDLDDDDEEFVPGGLAHLLTPRALQRLQRLEHAGLIETDAAGDPVVPVALRGAVARGVILTMTLLAADELEE